MKKKKSRYILPDNTMRNMKIFSGIALAIAIICLILLFIPKNISEMVFSILFMVGSITSVFGAAGLISAESI